MRLSQIFGKWVQRRRRRSDLEALWQLDDHMLKDIGVRRSDLFADLRQR